MVLLFCQECMDLKRPQGKTRCKCGKSFAHILDGNVYCNFEAEILYVDTQKLRKELADVNPNAPTLRAKLTSFMGFGLELLLYPESQLRRIGSTVTGVSSRKELND